MVFKISRIVALALVLSASALSAPILSATTAWAGGGFVSVIDDLPLMAALSEVGQGVEFATEQGRIVEATATGQVTKAQVLDFYAETLPQLGWTRAGDARFVREGEALDLIFTHGDDTLSVRFSLAPSGK